MIRVWLLLFVMSLSTAFFFHRPDGMIKMPLSKEFPSIPADVFYYHTFEHVGKIINAVVLLSFVLWPSENQKLAYIVLICIEVVDLILYLLYYRDWGLPVPWNITKTIIFGSVTLYLQWKETSLYR